MSEPTAEDVRVYAYGGWPGEEIDHINGEKSDNRLANLRKAMVGRR